MNREDFKHNLQMVLIAQGVHHLWDECIISTDGSKPSYEEQYKKNVSNLLMASHKIALEATNLEFGENNG